MSRPSARPTLWATDTSVVIAAVDPEHEAHRQCRSAVLEFRPALAGHAAFEAHAVLTRLPPALRLTPAEAVEVLAANFPQTCWLDAEAAHWLRTRLGEHRIGGGATFDALVGAAARSSGRTLLTRDRRAQRTYEQLDVTYRFVE